MPGLQTIAKRVYAEEAYVASLLPREPDILVDFDSYTLQYKIRNSETGQLVDSYYKPFPTTLNFHKDKSLVKLIMGPFGSGKSSACLAEIIFHSSSMPFCQDGKRHSKIAIVRNTYDMLKDTTLASWKQWFAELGTAYETQRPIRINLKYTDQWGQVEAALVFLALDKPDQLRNLFSSEFSMAYFNEAQFIEENAVGLMVPRIGRYPKKAFIINQSERRFKQIIMDTNPPDEDHWIYRWFEIDKIEDYRIFKQPPGLVQDTFGKWYDNPNRENNKDLDSTYYTDAAKGKSQEWIKVYCLGEYGLMKDGQLVHPNFSSDLHLVNEGIIPNSHAPIYLGFDFGLTPACTIEQRDAEGRLYTLHEITTFGLDLRQMVEQLLLPLLNTKFKDFEIGCSWYDPSGADPSQATGESCVDILEHYQLKPDKILGRYQDNIEKRIRACNKPIDMIIGGKPAYYLDGKNCPMLKKAFLKEYKFKRMLVGGNEPKYADKPDKNKYSHIMEAHHYLCFGIFGDREKVNNFNAQSVIGFNQNEWGF